MNKTTGPLAATGVVAFLGVLNQTLGYFKSFTDLLRANTHLPTEYLLPLCLAPFAWYFVKYISERASRQSTIKDFDVLNRALASPTRPYGRQKELRTLEALLDTAPVVHLTGDSGVGKSTLLVSGLIPSLRSRSNVLVIYVDTYAQGDWERSLRVTLAASLWKQLDGKLASDLDIKSSDRPDRLDYALRELNKRGTRLFVVMDQFDNYLRAHRSDFVTAGSRTWISWQALTDGNRLWAELRNLLADDVLHLLLCVRSADSASALTFAADGVEVLTLERPGREVVFSTLDALTSEGFVADPANGWVQLCDRLAVDLSKGGVLPVRMEVVLRGLISFKYLNVRSYLDGGGLNGLETDFILDRCEAAAEVAGIRRPDALRILLALRYEQNDVEAVRSVEQLSIATSLPARHVMTTLKLLESHRIVKRRLDADGDAELWSLYHLYLLHSISHAEERISYWSVLLREYHAAHVRAGSVSRAWWSTLLAPSAQCALLWRDIVERRVRKEYRRYRIISALRWIPYFVVAAGFVILCDAGMRVPGSDTVRMRLDVWHSSFFRPHYSEADVKSIATVLANKAKAGVAKRIVGGWAMTRGVQSSDFDYWLQPQEIVAELRYRDANMPSLVERLRTMLQPGMMLRDCQGNEIGWPGNRSSTEVAPLHVRAEPALWASDAVVLSLNQHAKGLNAVQQDYLRRQARRLSGVLASHLTPDGAWNRYPNQVNLREHSTYVTALALISLLDDAQAEQPNLLVNGETSEALALKAAQWLVNTYDYQESRPGWREYASASISEPLSTFVFSALSRAAAELPSEFGLIAPPAVARLRADFKEVAVTTPKTVGSDYTERSYMEVIAPWRPNGGGPAGCTDRRIQTQDVVTFTSYPWMVDLMDRGRIRGVLLGWTVPERQRAVQNIGELLGKFGTKYTDRVLENDAFTYQVSELLYVLEPLTRIGE